jgi:hypothetical protein
VLHSDSRTVPTRSRELLARYYVRWARLRQRAAGVRLAQRVRRGVELRVQGGALGRWREWRLRRVAARALVRALLRPRPSRSAHAGRVRLREKGAVRSRERERGRAAAASVAAGAAAGSAPQRQPREVSVTPMQLLAAGALRTAVLRWRCVCVAAAAASVAATAAAAAATAAVPAAAAARQWYLWAFGRRARARCALRGWAALVEKVCGALFPWGRPMRPMRYGTRYTVDTVSTGTTVSIGRLVALL